MLLAAELVAFDTIEPALRSRGVSARKGQDFVVKRTTPTEHNAADGESLLSAVSGNITTIRLATVSKIS
jgi:hypothetical protein